MYAKILTGTISVLLILGAGLPLARADEGHGRPMRDRGHEMGTHQESTGHFLRHLLKHSKEIGLSTDQVAKLQAIQLDLGRTRIRTEADIQVAELELAALVADEKADLSAIESKVKQSENLESALRMAAIKAKRDALGLLSPEQREKEKAEHEKMMRQMAPRGPGMMGGMGGGGMMGEGMMGPGGRDAPAQGSPKAGQEKQDEHRH